MITDGGVKLRKKEDQKIKHFGGKIITRKSMVVS
jgi:hypothetical protein